MLQNTAHIVLLRVLLQQESPVTAKELADKLDVSIRTIKSYVAQINASASSRVIYSGRMGYHADRPRAIQLIGQGHEQAIPQNYQERSIFILRKLTVENKTNLTIFDICEELCVGYSTLKNDISKLNREYASSNTRIVQKGNDLILEGSEADKRKLISRIIFSDASETLINLSILKQNFPSHDVDCAADLVRHAFAGSEYFLNDFAYMNVVLHVLILVSRIRSGDSFSDIAPSWTLSPSEHTFSNLLCSQIEEVFNIQLNDQERHNIACFARSNAYLIATHGVRELHNRVNEPIIKLCLELIKLVYSTYMVDLSSEQFLVPFTLHIQNLIMRSGIRDAAPNPMLETIRRECPLIFDIATCIAMHVQKRLTITISDNEIAYLALHVGAEIERQKTSSDKVSCVMICPDYRGIAEDLYNRFLIRFSNYVELIQVVSFEDDMCRDVSCDLIISTIPLNREHAAKTLCINPLTWEKSQHRIMHAIEQIYTERKNRILCEEFDTYFDERLFFAETNISERYRLIDMLCDHLESFGYVMPEYRFSVTCREEAASTAFGHIAIPHSISMDALQTCVSVLISKEGIKWGTTTVYVVFLVAMSGINMKEFRNVYEALVSLFDNDTMVQALKHVQSFEEFRELVTARAILA